MSELSGEQKKVFRASFDIFDTDHDGQINKEDLRRVFMSLGQNPSDEELVEMICAVDLDHNYTISFDEFAQMMAQKVPEESKAGQTGDSKLIVKDEGKLESDLMYRFEYMCEFMGISPNDLKIVHACKSVLEPRLDDIVADCFKKLWTYSSTKQVFFKDQDLDTLASTGAGSKGAAKWKSVSDQLSVQRRLTLKAFMEKLLNNPYDAAQMAEMNRLGKIHSTKGGHIKAPLLHVNVMLGFLQDEILSALFNHRATESDAFNAAAAARAFCKVFAVVGEFISKHYV
jgi:hypothetical protein